MVIVNQISTANIMYSKMIHSFLPKADVQAWQFKYHMSYINSSYVKSLINCSQYVMEYTLFISLSVFRSNPNRGRQFNHIEILQYFFCGFKQNGYLPHVSNTYKIFTYIFILRPYTGIYVNVTYRLRPLFWVNPEWIDYCNRHQSNGAIRVWLCNATGALFETGTCP